MSIHNREEELLKRAFKEAIKEWLDEKYAVFGKWTLRTLAAATLTAVLYFILVMQGWHR